MLLQYDITLENIFKYTIIKYITHTYHHTQTYIRVNPVKKLTNLHCICDKSHHDSKLSQKAIILRV